MKLVRIYSLPISKKKNHPYKYPSNKSLLITQASYYCHRDAEPTLLYINGLGLNSLMPGSYYKTYRIPFS